MPGVLGVLLAVSRSVVPDRGSVSLLAEEPVAEVAYPSGGDGSTIYDNNGRTERHAEHRHKQDGVDARDRMRKPRSNPVSCSPSGSDAKQRTYAHHGGGGNTDTCSHRNHPDAANEPASVTACGCTSRSPSTDSPSRRRFVFLDHGNIPEQEEDQGGQNESRILADEQEGLREKLSKHGVIL